MSTPVETNLTLRHLFRFARAPYRMLLGPDARISGVHGRGCVCFSPEPFVTVCGRLHFHVSHEGNGAVRYAGSAPLAGNG